MNKEFDLNKIFKIVLTIVLFIILAPLIRWLLFIIIVLVLVIYLYFKYIIKKDNSNKKQYYQEFHFNYDDMESNSDKNRSIENDLIIDAEYVERETNE